MRLIAPDLILNTKNGTDMERIDLFDRYFNGELSEEESIRFKEKLDEDEEFAFDFMIYSMTVAGICKEAEQDNVDFGVAMKHLSKDQLYAIIGRKPKAISREDVINRLQARTIFDRGQRAELSGAAAFDDIDDDEYTDDNQDDNYTSFVNDKTKVSINSLRLFTFIFIAIMILLIIITVLL